MEQVTVVLWASGSISWPVSRNACAGRPVGRQRRNARGRDGDARRFRRQHAARIRRVVSDAVGTAARCSAARPGRARLVVAHGGAALHRPALRARDLLEGRCASGCARRAVGPALGARSRAPRPQVENAADGRTASRSGSRRPGGAVRHRSRRRSRPGDGGSLVRRLSQRHLTSSPRGRSRHGVDSTCCLGGSGRNRPPSGAAPGSSNLGRCWSSDGAAAAELDCRSEAARIPGDPRQGSLHRPPMCAMARRFARPFDPRRTSAPTWRRSSTLAGVYEPRALLARICRRWKAGLPPSLLEPGR